MGREADYLVKPPDGLDGWIDNFVDNLAILSRELTLPGLVIAGVALAARCGSPRIDGALWTLTLSGLGFFTFALVFHEAVLAEAILMMSLPALVMGVLLCLALIWERREQFGWLAAALTIAWGGGLIVQQVDFVTELTEDDTGLAAIDSASAVPRGDDPVFMLSWGPRYFAASYSRLISGENADLAHGRSPRGFCDPRRGWQYALHPTRYPVWLSRRMVGGTPGADLSHIRWLQSGETQYRAADI